MGRTLFRSVQLAFDDEVTKFFNRKFGFLQSYAVLKGIHISRDGLKPNADSPEGTKRNQE